MCLQVQHSNTQKLAGVDPWEAIRTGNKRMMLKAGLPPVSCILRVSCRLRLRGAFSRSKSSLLRSGWMLSRCGLKATKSRLVSVTHPPHSPSFFWCSVGVWFQTLYNILQTKTTKILHNLQEKNFMKRLPHFFFVSVTFLKFLFACKDYSRRPECVCVSLASYSSETVEVKSSHHRQTLQDDCLSYENASRVNYIDLDVHSRSHRSKSLK